MIRKKVIKEHEGKKYITEDFIFRMTPDEMDAIAVNKEKEPDIYELIQKMKQQAKLDA